MLILASSRVLGLSWAAQITLATSDNVSVSLKIISDLDTERLASALPPWLRARLMQLPLVDRVTLAVFGDKEIVTSGAVARLRRKLAGAPEHLVVGACGFTQEAEQSLLAQGATLVSAGELHWTDAGYAAVHRPGSV